MNKFSEYYDLIELSSDGKTSIIEIVKVGKIFGRGVTITEAMLDEYIANFEKGVYRTELQVNLRHDREGEAAGWIKKLYKNDGVLFAQVEWTSLGVDKITSRQFRYTSSELAESYIDPVTGAKAQNVLIGVALTNIPQVKGMAPVSLSEDSPYSENCVSFINLLNMKDKVKGLYAALEKKGACTPEEMSELMAACKDSGMSPEDMADMKKKVGAFGKVAEKKMSEGGDGEEKEEEEKEGDENEGEGKESGKEEKELTEKVGKTVSLSEFKKAQKLAEDANAKSIQLQERLDRADLKEEIQAELVLSEDLQTGFVNDEDGKVLDFMMSLSQEQRATFKELVGKVQTVDLSVRGSTNVSKVSGKSKDDAAVDEADKRAAELSEKTGRPLAECLSEEYRKLAEAKL